MKLFADDAKIYAVVSNERENLVQTSLNRAVNWPRSGEYSLILLSVITYMSVNMIQG